MDSAIILTPRHTELFAIEDKFRMTGILDMIPVDYENLEIKTKNLFLDLTFDFFDKEITPYFLYTLFAKLQKITEQISPNITNFYVIKHYTYSTNIDRLIFIQRIIDQFVEILTDFAEARLILSPCIISRYCMNRVSNPASCLINTIRMNKSARIKISENSRFSIIYGLDLVSILMDIVKDGFSKPLVIEGIDMSLKEISDTAQRVAGDCHISFDKTNFFNFHFPDINAHFINRINYEFENIMIDLVSNLF
jgi:hypothetical protein